MRPLTNEFSWSFSRDRLFRHCLRAYYYHYYAYWGGWNVAAPPETRQLYLLRQLQSIASWVGGVVEWTLLEAIRRLRAGHPVDLATLQEWARQRLRAGWRESRRNVASPKPKLFRLFEHYYAKIDPAVVPEEHAPRARDRVRRCLEHAWNSGILTEIASVPEDAWLRLPAPIPPESPHRPLPDTLVLDQVRIWVGLDLAYRDGDLLRIRDWKTGHAYRGDRAQMDCYALYALAKWPHTRLHQVRTMLVYLENEGPWDEVTSTPESVNTTREWIAASVQRMRERLADPERNEARIEDFPVTEESARCWQCNFRAICPEGWERTRSALPPPEEEETPFDVE